MSPAYVWALHASESLHRGTYNPGHDDDGVVEADSIGHAYELVGKEIEWGLVADERPMTIEIRRVPTT